MAPDDLELAEIEDHLLKKQETLSFRSLNANTTDLTRDDP